LSRFNWQPVANVTAATTPIERRAAESAFPRANGVEACDLDMPKTK
jgi:hypothetical protein